jgi:glycosyltransferase involved in cell wall biosynthesis
MKIVVNAFSARLGGGQTYLRNLFAHLPHRDDLEVLVFAAKGLALPPHPCVRLADVRWPTANPLTRALWEQFVLPRLLRRERADVLFCPGGVVATRVPKGCRVVTMFRNMIPFDPVLLARMPWGLQRLRNLVLSHVLLRSMVGADLTIFISDHARAVIEARVHVPAAVTIPHGIADAFRTHDLTLPRPAGAPAGAYLLYVSRFDIYKHHTEVVRGYASLPAATRECHQLLLLGEVNLPEAVRVARLVEKLGLLGQVHMPGAVPHEELPAYYRHAHAVLFASSCENCPNILLEALGAGQPVLSSNVMPMPEFGGEAPVYFSPFAPASIATAIRSVLDNPARADRAAGAALVRSRRYDWSRTGAETWRRIFELAGAETSTRA